MREMASAIRIALPTAVTIARRIDLVKQWRGIPQRSSNKCRSIHSMKARFPINTPRDFGYTDVADLLSTPERDFLVKNNGQKVPVSSLKGKLVGLYLCESIPQPPRMQAIKKVYEEAKARGYDFEIVEITFPIPYFNGKHPTVEHWCGWLTLPFTDPSCRKIQRIFECVDDGYDDHWVGDCLVLIHPCQSHDSSRVLFEFSGAEILKQWGIQGYPFTRSSLYKAEYEIQKREVRLQLLFPPGECLLRPRRQSAIDGFDLVDPVSHLSGKRVLVFFAPHSDHPDLVSGRNFLSMLKAEYEAQLEDNVAEENKFEVVYVSPGSSASSFVEFTKDMPWLVRPFASRVDLYRLFKVFKPYVMGSAVLAFNEQGELIAKEDLVGEKKEDLKGEKKEGDKLRFPFIDQDLEKRIRGEVEALCDMDDS